MINFFEQHPDYFDELQAEANAPRPNLAHVRSLRQGYKVIVGGVFGEFLQKTAYPKSPLHKILLSGV